MKNIKNRQSGFTIIELVMVIVILGILSAFALPRFADFGAEAREASLAGVAGAVKSAAAIAHAQQLVDNGTPGASVVLEGETITMVNTYPTANDAGIVAAAGIDTTNDYTVSGAGTAGGTTLTIAIRANCHVTYTAATATGADNTTALDSAYVIAIEDSGCG